MKTFSFLHINNRAKTNAVALYWREALALIVMSFDIVDHSRRHNWMQSTQMQDIARLALEESGWLFTEHGERIA